MRDDGSAWGWAALNEMIIGLIERIWPEEGGIIGPLLSGITRAAFSVR